MTALLDFYRHIEVLVRNTDVGPVVVGVLTFRLTIDSIRKLLSEVREQRVTAGILMLRHLRSSTRRILVPVLVPVVGIARPNPNCDLV